MQPFDYRRAASLHEAIQLGRDPDAVYLAGGTELLNWMRIGITNPQHVVDIGRLEGLSTVERTAGGGVRIGALAKLNDVAQHPLIQQDYPVLSVSILNAASAQIRNLATIGGNPVQRVRCPYFRADEPTPCNKRTPGSGCAALHGFNEKHAIFGWTDDCVAVQPSDPAVALAALDAVIHTDGPRGRAQIPAARFHVLPADDPTAHNVLTSGELITHIEIGAPARQSAYLKIRERESYEFATASVAVALELDGTTIRSARIALGSVAMRPWRLHETEARLAGLSVDSPEIAAAVDAGFADARPLARNAYKIRLARNATIRTIETAARA
jgi:xanthine dehydrogenase YagS FAD-binding subunit